MNANEESKAERFLGMTKNQFMGLMLFLLAVLVGTSIWTPITSGRANQERIEDICTNQHSIIEMQRLFLQEHAAIRTQLLDAGIPAEHADPLLLRRLEVLIEAADCRLKR